MNSAPATYWRRMANGSDRRIVARMLVALLTPFSLCYGLIQRGRAVLYRRGFCAVKHLPRPVVSIGNITVGGTGKTPVTGWLAGRLLAEGYRVCVLSRGYGGTLEGTVAVVSDGTNILLGPRECGDEPYLLASTIPGLMVLIGSDRYAAGMCAMERSAPDVFLLDDGYQHIRLHRDMNILLLDASSPFGNGHCLPAGSLREPRSACHRADWVIHTRCETADVAVPDLGNIPRASAGHELRDLVPLAGDGGPIELARLQGRSVAAFAGIADPERFFADLQRCGARLVHTASLPDHVRYDDRLIGDLLTADADFYVTTEKDAVKLRSMPRKLDSTVMVARLRLTVHGGERLFNDLRNLLQKS